MISVIVKEKETLGSKLKKIYEQTSERMPDEESRQNLHDLFNKVMSEREPNTNVIENEDIVQ